MSEDVENKELKLKDNGNKLDFRDITQSYLYFRNYISGNPIEEYNVKRKCIEIGKELLPMDLKDKNEQDEIKNIYNIACSILKEEKPEKRSIEFDFQDFGKDQVLPVYKIRANDADPCHAEKEELKDILSSFIDMQYQFHMDKLQEVDDMIFHELIKRNIIEKFKPTINNIFDKKIKKIFEKG